MNLVKIKSNPVVAKIIAENNISDDQILEAYSPINDFLIEYQNCDYGPMIECKQPLVGWTKTLTYENGLFYLKTDHCQHWKYEHKNEALKAKFKYIDYDLDLFPFTPKEYIEQLNEEPSYTKAEKTHRINIISDAHSRMTNNFSKGLYIYGEPGIGKTTVAKVIANFYAQKGKTVFFANVSNLFNDIKEEISKERRGKYNSLIFNLKSSDILILDDIGGETVSTWSRDDILTSVLNYRMENRKITYFTSNLSPDQLTTHYVSKKIPNNQMMKRRFLERIKALSISYEMKGNNHRS